MRLPLAVLYSDVIMVFLQEDMGRIRGVYEFYASAHPSGTMQLVDLGSFLEETVRDDLDGVDIHLQSVLEARERQGIDLQSMQEALGRVITMCEGHTAETNELSLQESCVVEQLSYELNCHSVSLPPPPPPPPPQPSHVPCCAVTARYDY